MIEPDKFTREALRQMSEYTWTLKLSIRPRVCNKSGAKIPMFTYAYYGYRIIQGPYDAMVISRWLLPVTYLLEKLKGNVE